MWYTFDTSEYGFRVPLMYVHILVHVSSVISMSTVAFGCGDRFACITTRSHGFGYRMCKAN